MLKIVFAQRATCDLNSCCSQAVFCCPGQSGTELLTHWRQVTRICIGRLTIVSHYLTQRWNNVDWTLGTIFNPVLFIFIQKNAFQNVVWKMVAILSWPHCVAYTIPAMICTVIVYRTGVMVSIDVTIHILCWPFKMLSRGYNSSICNYIPRIRRIGGCYGFTSKPPAARRPPPAARRPPPAARNGVNAITQKPLDGLFSNLVYTLVVIVSWPD